MHDPDQSNPPIRPDHFLGLAGSGASMKADRPSNRPLLAFDLGAFCIRSTALNLGLAFLNGVYCLVLMIFVCQDIHILVSEEKDIHIW
jgi:hypothetical protein